MELAAVSRINQIGSKRWEIACLPTGTSRATKAERLADCLPDHPDWGNRSVCMFMFHRSAHDASLSGWIRTWAIKCE
jgi:hypothetical protein